MKRKPIAISLIGGLVLFGSYAFRPVPAEHGDHENHLVVLPKDITHDELMQVMESFTVATGMGCGQCHARSAEDPAKLDFGADHKAKQVALDMMRMVQDMNAKYFAVEGDFKGNYLNSNFKVSCNSCHNGHAKPVSRIAIPIPDPRWAGGK